MRALLQGRQDTVALQQDTVEKEAALRVSPALITVSDRGGFSAWQDSWKSRTCFPVLSGGGRCGTRDAAPEPHLSAQQRVPAEACDSVGPLQVSSLKHSRPRDRISSAALESSLRKQVGGSYGTLPATSTSRCWENATEVAISWKHAATTPPSGYAKRSWKQTTAENPRPVFRLSNFISTRSPHINSPRGIGTTCHLRWKLFERNIGPRFTVAKNGQGIAGMGRATRSGSYMK
jgi:hypothetical protein